MTAFLILTMFIVGLYGLLILTDQRRGLVLIWGWVVFWCWPAVFSVVLSFKEQLR